jgi:hypothetical protein
MNLSLEVIVDVLNRKNIRATYGAVAGVLGGNPQVVMKGQAVSQQNSWVVNARTGQPTGYRPSQMHPNLRRLPIIFDCPVRLQRFLDGGF